MLGFGDRKQGLGKLKYNQPDPADRAMPTNLWVIRNNAVGALGAARVSPDWESACAPEGY
jgi:hypothetical protein